MNELRIAKKYAITRLDSPTLPLPDTEGSLRIYQNSPESVMLQIRTVGKVTNTRNGVTRRAYSSVSLDADDLLLIIEALQQGRHNLRAHHAARNPVQLRSNGSRPCKGCREEGPHNDDCPESEGT